MRAACGRRGAGVNAARPCPIATSYSVYDAGRAIAAERPEALAFIPLEFFERRDLFLVSRESGMAFP
jgi:hypothetical protein